MKSPLPLRHSLFFLALLAAVTVHGWDYNPGHRIVNQLALAALPADFPTFVREPASAERIAFLAGEPDRWRNVPDLIMMQSGGSWADHYLDLEMIPDAGLDLAKVPSFRYDFILQFAAGRATHLENFPAIDPAKNTDHTREWPGFAPWAITEYYTRLRSAFSYLKVLEELGTREEVANAQANIVYLMGVMGHYVGDCAQPLHTTVHHNGWVGPNPNGYTTWRGFHAWVDGKEGGIFAKAGIELASLLPRVRPAQAIGLTPRNDGREPMFVAVLEYLLRQNKQVEPLYQLEKAGKLGNNDRPVAGEGRAFIEDRLCDGGEMLASIWVTAWKNAVVDTFLRGEMLRLRAAAAPAKTTP